MRKIAVYVSENGFGKIPDNIRIPLLSSLTSLAPNELHNNWQLLHQKIIVLQKE
jgi:hypothetical protein